MNHAQSRRLPAPPTSQCPLLFSQIGRRNSAQFVTLRLSQARKARLHGQPPAAFHPGGMDRK
jgi:hypothetical protein